MLGKQIFPLLFVLATAFTSCGKSTEAARLKLAQLNIPSTEQAFIENARQGNNAALSLFLEAGMSAETRTYDGQSALLVAALANQTEAVKLLLDKGADANAQDKFGGTALLNAARSELAY